MPAHEFAARRVVTAAEWHREQEAFRAREKIATELIETLVMERQKLPLLTMEKSYVFEGASGKRSLLELFEGRKSLIVYHFMFRPGQQKPCEGCSTLVDQLGYLPHLHVRDATLALVSRAPIAELLDCKKRLRWAVPWYSSFGTDFNDDFGVTQNEQERSGLSIFVRDGATVYRAYHNNGPDSQVDPMWWSILDLAPGARQESWEDTKRFFAAARGELAAHSSCQCQ